MSRGKAVSEEIRKVIIHLHSKGKSAAQIADIVNLSRYTVRNIIKLYKTTGSVAQKQRNGSRPHYSDTNLRALRRIIMKNRRANYGELRVLWNQATDKCFSRATCHRAARKLGFKTYKVSSNCFRFVSVFNFTICRQRKSLY